MGCQGKSGPGKIHEVILVFIKDANKFAIVGVVVVVFVVVVVVIVIVVVVVVVVVVHQASW